MNIYSELGIRPIINAAGTYTVLGGSRMSEGTLAAMRDAAAEFVPIRDLQKAVHSALAKLTNNPAAYVPNGAASGLYLAVAASIEMRRGKPFRYLTRDDIARANVVMFKAHRNPYDLVIGQLGAQCRELGFANLIHPPTEEDLANAIDTDTAAICFAASGWVAQGALLLDRTIAVAKARGVPVIVDAAAQLPPLENLWRFTEQGAACTLFSGGKDLHGPQASGLMVGEKDFHDRVASIGFPNYGVGRMMKVGREELLGLYAAVKEYVAMDHAARFEWCERQVALVTDALAGSKSLSASRSFPNEAGQPIARAFVEVIAPGRTGDDLQAHLKENDPPIHTLTENRNGVYVNPMSLREGETEIVIRRLKKF